MNVLNLAIDQEAVLCVKALQEQYKSDPEAMKSLVHHRYSKDMQAVH